MSVAIGTAYEIKAWINNDELIQALIETEHVKQEENQWEQTDDLQFVRKINEHTFEIWDQTCYGEDKQYTSTFFETIDITDYSKEEISRLLKTYGMTLSELNTEVNKNQIIAEIIAETSDNRYQGKNGKTKIYE